MHNTTDLHVHHCVRVLERLCCRQDAGAALVVDMMAQRSQQCTSSHGVSCLVAGGNTQRVAVVHDVAGRRSNPANQKTSRSVIIRATIIDN